MQGTAKIATVASRSTIPKAHATASVSTTTRFVRLLDKMIAVAAMCQDEEEEISFDMIPCN
jgi:hypothetical protein